MTSNDTLTSDNPVFWQTRYRQQSTPWDLAGPAPAFQALLDESNLTPGKMAVLGSGYGHDAALFGKAGFQVTGLDFAPEAVDGAKARYGDLADFIQADIFHLPQDMLGTFDYVLEHTCFCAIRPNQRQDYTSAAAGLLKPGGRFIGIFWAHEEWGGPPYKTNPDEVRSLFSPYFEIHQLAPTPHSIPERQGQELLAVFERKPSSLSSPSSS